MLKQHFNKREAHIRNRGILPKSKLPADKSTKAKLSITIYK